VIDLGSLRSEFWAMLDYETDPIGKGADTRTRLIEVAVEHFADHGFTGASQRAIQRAAGVNPASAHYHFGSKEALYRAVIHRFIHSVQEDRIRRHAAIPREVVGTERLRCLLTDYFAPGFAVAATPSGFHYTRILARVRGERRSQSVAIFDEIVEPVRAVYMTSLQALFPHVAHKDVSDSLAMGVTLMANIAVAIRHRELLVRGGAEVEGQRLAGFVAAGFEAVFGVARH